MYLYSIELFNFRGIRHLYLDFEQDTTALIGENAWGKSSLLRALWLVLGQGNSPCQFSINDLYVPLDLENGAINSVGYKDTNQFLEQYKNSHDIENQNSQHLHKIYEFLAKDVFESELDTILIKLCFKEANYGLVAKSSRLQRLEPLWNLGEDGLHYINYQIKGYAKNKVFCTEHNFTNTKGEVIKCDVVKYVSLLISMNPVIRIRDSRMYQNVDYNANDNDLVDSVKRLGNIVEDNDVSASDVQDGLNSLNLIVNKYLGYYSQHGVIRKSYKRPRTVKDIVNQPLSVQSLSSLKRSLQTKGITRAKIILSILAGALIASQGGKVIDKRARPIVILEDIEGRLHPSLLSSFLAVLDLLPAQKFITTNSGELLSSVALASIRRMCRRLYDTRCYKVDENLLNYDDLRRITFHIRVNRPMSLFARTWILVEGETEVWILTELARIMGIGLYSEGARIVEFAQCGLPPLLKLSRSLGISIFVLTDGDEAGIKYANSVREFVGSDHATKHLLQLPHLDIEHFFFFNGYKHIFYREAGIKPNVNLKNITADKIINAAIKRKTKPGLALSIVEEVQKRGINGIPKIMQKMYFKIRRLSQNQFSLD